jgi:hypothetical protein
MISKTELLARLPDREDHFTERKPDSATPAELRNTLVGFANSVPQGRVAVLYIGVANDGTLLGVSNSDSKQKNVRQLCDTCYPPLLAQSEVLDVDGKAIVAVAIPESVSKPHFSGGCYVRRGSETCQASEEEYRKLLLHQIDKCRFMTRHMAAQWTVRGYGRHIDDPQPLEQNFSEAAECVLEDCNPFYARFRRVSAGSYFSVEMHAISPMWDDRNSRPMAIIRPIRYAGGA